MTFTASRGTKNNKSSVKSQNLGLKTTHCKTVIQCTCFVVVQPSGTETKLNAVALQQTFPVQGMKTISEVIMYKGDVLFCSLAVLDPRVGLTMNVLSPFISILVHKLHRSKPRRTKNRNNQQNSKHKELSPTEWVCTFPNFV